MTPQGVFLYNGIAADGACSITRSAGTTPGTIAMSFILAAPIEQFGTVEILYGSRYVRLSDCRVVKTSVSGGAGRMRQAVIQDRRWRWEYATLELDRWITRRELAKTCFQVLGESLVDVSAVPEDTLQASYECESAATVLNTILADVGLQVAPTWDDKFRIVAIGNGVPAPTDDPRVSDATISNEKTVIPEVVCVTGSEIAFQRDLLLEPVGYEKEGDERTVPIDELSYKPTGGWMKCRFGSTGFREVDVKHRQLAQSTIMKVFRIVADKYPLPGLQAFRDTVSANSSELESVGYGGDLKYIEKVFSLDAIERILPLNNYQISFGAYHPVPPNYRSAPPMVIGWFYRGRSKARNNRLWSTFTLEFIKNSINFRNANGHPWFGSTKDIHDTFPELIYGGGLEDASKPGDNRSFNVDEKKGLVVFQEPVYWVEPDTSVSPPGRVAKNKLPPLIYLRTSFPIRDITTGAPLRQKYFFKIQNGARGIARTIVDENMDFEYWLDSNGEQSDSTEAFASRAMFYVNREILRHGISQSASIPMKGFVFDYNVDGAIRSITISKSDGGECTTQIDWQTERPEERITFDQKTMAFGQRMMYGNQLQQKVKGSKKRNVGRKPS